MTVIAVKNGVVASDSRYNIETESGGIRYQHCDKLFRKIVDGKEFIICTAGEGPPGMAFYDWYGSGKEAPELFVHGEADFTVLVIHPDGTMMEYDKWCRGEKVYPTEGCYAIGCGAKAAMGAMLAGASAQRAVEVTLKIDQLCGPPVITMRFKNGSAKKTRRSAVPKVRKADGEGTDGGKREDSVGVQEVR